MLTSTAEPPYEMISMKLPAELFELVTLAKKQEQKRQETVSFVCLGLGAKAPFGQTIVAQANCKFRQTAHTFMIVKYSVLYFTWKLDRICAKILYKMLHILASNSLGGLPVIRYSNDADKEN